MDTIVRGRIVTPAAVLEGAVGIADGRIAQVGPDLPSSGCEYDFGAALVLPGFIDIHIHGIGEYGAVDKAGVAGMSEIEPRYGTTSFLPTGAGMTVEQYVSLGAAAGGAAQEMKGKGAKILGVHLEGPFINPESSGAMSLASRRPISLEETRKYMEQIGDIFKLMTVSAELEGSLDLIRYLSSNGVVVSLGHSIADPACLPEFTEAGLSHVCHMFNTFVPAGFKEPGVMDAGLAEHILADDALTCEIICDMVHVTPQHVVIAARVLAPDRFVAITDSLRGTGLEGTVHQSPDGRKYRVHDAGRDVESGQLTGSVLTMDKAFANLVVRCNVDPVTAARFTSANAARVLGVYDRAGSLECGKQADIAVLDEDYRCLATFVDGEIAYDVSDS